MEGVAGIVDWDQCRPGSDGYAHGCALLPDEVNAAIEGALAGGCKRSRAERFAWSDDEPRSAQAGAVKVITKESIIRFSAKSLHPATSCRLIRAGAEKAVRKVAARSMPVPGLASPAVPDLVFQMRA
jgi:D-aminopeptidase